jgi:hypothetical protein
MLRAALAAAQHVAVPALVRRRWRLMAVAFVVCLVMVVAGGLLRDSRYTSQVTVIVTPPPPTPPDYPYIPPFETARITRDVFLSRAAAQATANVRGRSVDSVRAATTAVAGEGWETIELTYTDTTADGATATATAGVDAGIALARGVVPSGTRIALVGVPSVGARQAPGASYLLASVWIALTLSLLTGVLADAALSRRPGR